MTSTQITIARMLAAYDAWQPDADEDAAMLDEIGDILDNYGLLECSPEGIYVPNANGRALIDRARAEGHIAPIVPAGGAT